VKNRKSLSFEGHIEVCQAYKQWELHETTDEVSETDIRRQIIRHKYQIESKMLQLPWLAIILLSGL
jgi:hypothetical protein